MPKIGIGSFPSKILFFKMKDVIGSWMLLIRLRVNRTFVLVYYTWLFHSEQRCIRFCVIVSESSVFTQNLVMILIVHELLLSSCAISLRKLTALALQIVCPLSSHLARLNPDLLFMFIHQFISLLFSYFIFHSPFLLLIWSSLL